MHLDTAKHKNAAMDDARYAGVDTLIKQGVCWEDFVKSVNKKSVAIPCNNEQFRPFTDNVFIPATRTPADIHTQTGCFAVNFS